MRGVYGVIIGVVRQNCSKKIMIHCNFVHLKFHVKYLKNMSEKRLTRGNSCVTEFKNKF